MMVVTEIKEHVEVFVISINQQDLVAKQLRKTRMVLCLCNFPVVMYGCESWTVKKAERGRIDAFELWCWRIESPLDCKEIKPVNPKENQS